MVKSSIPTVLAATRNLTIVAAWNDPVPHANCLADCQLNGTLPSKPVSNPNVGPNGSVIWSSLTETFENHDCLVGAVFEFDFGPWIAVPNITFQVYLRQLEQALPAWTDPVLASDEHVRGWWPQSTMELTVNTERYDVNPDLGGEAADSSICEPDGPEVDPAQPKSFHQIAGLGHEHDKTNKGCYGVNLTYRGTFRNTNPQPANGYLYIEARNTWTVETNAKYWGAFRLESEDVTEMAKAPALQGTSGDPGNPNDNSFQYVNVRPSETPGLNVPGSNGERVFKVYVANGGASALPANLLQSRIALVQP